MLLQVFAISSMCQLCEINSPTDPNAITISWCQAEWFHPIGLREYCFSHNNNNAAVFWQSIFNSEPDVDTYFLAPITFSRVDSSNPQLFRKEQTKSLETDIDNGLIGVYFCARNFRYTFTLIIESISGKTRLRRQKHTQYIPFQLNDPLPTAPKDVTCNFLKLKFISTGEYNLVKEVIIGDYSEDMTFFTYDFPLQFCSYSINDRLCPKWLLPTKPI